MQHWLNRICDGIIEAGWLTALVVTPLFFNTHSSRVFEPDKTHLLRSIVLIMGVAWLTSWLASGPTGPDRNLRRKLTATPLVLPVLLLVVAYLVSTALSIVPRISLVGSYVRLQGLLTFLCYASLFFLVLSKLRTRQQLVRLYHTVILTSLPIAIYGLLQHYGLDPLPWGGDVRERIASTMGNAIFVGAYLIIAFFLTLERLVDSVGALLGVKDADMVDALRAGVYIFILTVQLIAIVFTQSRGPWLGLAAGTYIFVLIGARLLARWASATPSAPSWLRDIARPVWIGVIGLTVVGLIVLVVMNLPRSPLAGLRNVPYLGRMASALDTGEGTNAVRVLIWEGVEDLMLQPHAPLQPPDGAPDRWHALRPLIGYGPESMWVAFNRFYPPQLARYEARNASPDRAHNETFDALVRTGLIGTTLQLVLFGSLFYYSLRWLGLVESRARRNLFIALLTGGALLGVILPRLIDGSLRLAGIGLPAGLVAGLIVYVTIDLFSSGVSGQDSSTADQLVILSLLSAIIAFFVEVHFGIAIVSTLTHFWVLAAVLVVAGSGRLGDASEPGVPATMSLVATAPPHAQAQHPRPTGRHGAASLRSSPRQTGTKRAPHPQNRSATAASPADLGWRPFLPYAGIAAIVSLVLAWDFMMLQTGALGPVAILVDSFTKRIDRATLQSVISPGLPTLLVLTWFCGGVLAFSESRRTATGTPGRPSPVLPIVFYAGATVGVFLLFGLIHASRLSVRGPATLDTYRQIAGHVVFFDLALFLLMLILGGLLAYSSTATSAAAPSTRRTAAAVGAGMAALVVASLVIVSANIRSVQADVYYKQGLAYENAGDWESAAIMYREATRAQPREDYYYLFLGRALLQVATGTTASPTDPSASGTLAGLPMADLIAAADQGMRAGSREDLLRATYAILLVAQQLNPYNTDHTANVARLQRAWALLQGVQPGELLSEGNVRTMVSTRLGDDARRKLAEAEASYLQATALSPNNAQLWNELASVQFALSKAADAYESLQQSQELDAEYARTYLLRGEFQEADGDMSEALESYRQAARLSPSDTVVRSAIGVLSAQVGDTDGALAAFREIIEMTRRALARSEAQLASLDAAAEAAGGYDQLQGAAQSQRASLQGTVARQRAELSQTYLNGALVLRDATRYNEALQAAETALSFANAGERQSIEGVIADLKARIQP